MPAANTMVETWMTNQYEFSAGTSGTIVFTADGLPVAVPASDAQTTGAGATR